MTVVLILSLLALGALGNSASDAWGTCSPCCIAACSTRSRPSHASTCTSPAGHLPVSGRCFSRAPALSPLRQSRANPGGAHAFPASLSLVECLVVLLLSHPQGCGPLRAGRRCLSHALPSTRSARPLSVGCARHRHARGARTLCARAITAVRPRSRANPGRSACLPLRRSGSPGPAASVPLSARLWVSDHPFGACLLSALYLARAAPGEPGPA